MSTRGQNPDRQISKLKDYCDELIIEKFSAATTNKRDKFIALIDRLQRGDDFVIWELDRAFRNTKDALNYEEYFKQQGIHFTVLYRQVDTSTAEGKRDFQMRAVEAEYWRNLTTERTIEGLREAAKKGNFPGRQHKLSIEQLKDALQLVTVKGKKIGEVASTFGVEPWTLSRNFKDRLGWRSPFARCH